MVIPRRNRGKFHHQNTEYGESNLGNKLEIFLPDTTESNILILAGIHGDEPESIVFLAEALRSIPPDELKNPVILCANPDGILRGTRANANGVDLNRNFPVENWTDNPVFYRIKSGEPQDIELSTGTEPGSELETKAILKIIDEIKPQSIISFHSALDCIEDPNNTELGQWIASETGIPLVDDVGYPTPGSFGTWAKENSIPLITFEVPLMPLTQMITNYVPTLIQLLRNNHLPV